MSQVLREFLKWATEWGSWLYTRKNSRATHSEMKAKMHVLWAEFDLSQKARASLGETYSTDRM